MLEVTKVEVRESGKRKDGSTYPAFLSVDLIDENVMKKANRVFDMAFQNKLVVGKQLQGNIVTAKVTPYDIIDKTSGKVIRTVDTLTFPQLAGESLEIAAKEARASLAATPAAAPVTTEAFVDTLRG